MVFPWFSYEKLSVSIDFWYVYQAGSTPQFHPGIWGARLGSLTWVGETWASWRSIPSGND